MKAISLKAAGKPSIPEFVSTLKAFIASKSVTIAAISAIVCYLGCLADSDPVMFSGAFAALAALAPNHTKGGHK